MNKLLTNPRALTGGAFARNMGDSMDYGAIGLPQRPARAAGVVLEAAALLVMLDNGARRVPDFSQAMDRKDDPIDENAVKDFATMRAAFLTQHKQLQGFIAKATGEIGESGKVAKDTKEAMEKAAASLLDLGNRLDKIEAKANRLGEPNDKVVKTIGDIVIESDDFKSMSLNGKKATRARIDVKQIINATGQNQPLVPQMQLPGIQTLPDRFLRIRSLLPVGRTSSNLVQYAKELVFTNNAGPQAGNSPTVAAEGVAKNESDITFVLANAPVVTIAHFIRASVQVLDDAPMLQSYIDQRLTYGLALEEEDEILNGDGQVGNLDGLMHNATAFNRAYTGTKIDILRRSMTQLYLSEFAPECFILNPIDWEDIELTKDTQGRYIFANPQSLLGPTLWGRPVIVTNSMTQGQFLTANLTQAAQLWDRQSATVEVSREDADNFTKNMVTIRAEERVALTVYRATALIKGVFP